MNMADHLATAEITLSSNENETTATNEYMQIHNNSPLTKF